MPLRAYSRIAILGFWENGQCIYETVIVVFVLRSILLIARFAWVSITQIERKLTLHCLNPINLYPKTPSSRPYKANAYGISPISLLPLQT
jgi:hypothetical protein